MTAPSVFRNGKYEGYQSSEEVLRAIEIVSGTDIPDDEEDYEDSEAYRVWAKPSAEEAAAVEAEAWKLAEAETDRLFWGQHTMNRAA